MASACAMSWRISSSASGSLRVMMRILASCSMGRNRSYSLPSTRMISAALARPGPIAAAISPPVTPLAKVMALPSGKVTVTSSGAADTGISLKSQEGRTFGLSRRPREDLAFCPCYDKCSSTCGPRMEGGYSKQREGQSLGESHEKDCHSFGTDGYGRCRPGHCRQHLHRYPQRG